MYYLGPGRRTCPNIFCAARSDSVGRRKELTLAFTFANGSGRPWITDVLVSAPTLSYRGRGSTTLIPTVLRFAIAGTSGNRTDDFVSLTSLASDRDTFDGETVMSPLRSAD